MAQRLPAQFRKSPELLASYDYTDLTAGLGYIDFYLVQAKSTVGGTVSRHLVQETMHAAVSEDQYSAGTTSNDFDSSAFNMPRTVKGTAYVSGTIESGAGGAAGATSFQLIRVESDGSTEHTITSAVQTHPTVADNAPLWFCVPLTCTETTIKKGEYLRVTCSGSSAAGKSVYIGTNPMDEDGTTITPSSTDATTITKVSVPFRIDAI